MSGRTSKLIRRASGWAGSPTPARRLFYRLLKAEYKGLSAKHKAMARKQMFDVIKEA